MTTPDGLIFGVLTLYETALVFQPREGEDGHLLNLPRTSILSATVSPTEQRLMVEGMSQTHQFLGPSACVLGQRLISQLDPSDLLFHDNEALLMVTPVWSGPIYGKLLLTDRKLLFRTSGLWALLSRALGIPTTWSVGRDALHPAQTQARIQLRTQVLPSLPGPHGPLTGEGAMLLQSGNLHIGAEPIWHVRVSHGLLHHRGLLLLGQDTLQLIEGRTRTTLPLATIVRLESRRSTLCVHTTEHAPIQVWTQQADLLLQRLADLLLTREMAMSTRQPRFIWWRESTDAVLGQLDLSPTQLTFAPSGDILPAVRIPSDQVQRVLEPRNEIHLSSETQHFRFEPPRRGGFVERFWQEHRPPERVQQWPQSPRARKLMLQGQRSISLSDGGTYDVIFHPGLLLERADGFGVLVPEDELPPAAGQPLTVELGRPDGIYRFESPILRVEPAPSGMRFPKQGRVVVLGFPEQVRYYNQRAAFRVNMQLPVNAWRLRLDRRRHTWVPDGDRLRGRLLDLSASGCGLQTSASVRVGEHLFVELLLAEHWLPLEAECVRAEPGWPTGTTIGLQFQNIPERLGQLLSQTILNQQRLRNAGMMSSE